MPYPLCAPSYAVGSAIPQHSARGARYPRLIDMARDVDVPLVIIPGAPATRNLIDADVLEALGKCSATSARRARFGSYSRGDGSVSGEQSHLLGLRQWTLNARGMNRESRGHAGIAT